MQDGGKFLDGGAFSGQHTQHAVLAANGRVQVMAFEPDERARIILERNISLASIKDNVQVRVEALSGTDGWLELIPASKLSESKVSEDLADPSGATTIRVPCVSLARLVSEWNPTLLKLDLEGHERSALTSLRLIEERPDMIVEANPGAEAMGRSLGYETFTTHDLFPNYSNLTNLSSDIFMTNSRMVTPGFRKELSRQIASLFNRPSVVWCSSRTGSLTKT
jgi:FkbM family methyltransferase